MFDMIVKCRLCGLGKKIWVISIFVLMLIVLTMSSGCESDKKTYMVDNASVIGDDARLYIESRCDFIARKTGAEIVIKTVNNTGNSGIDIYSERFFEDYKIGDAKKNNGVLFVMSVEENEYRITVGKGLAGILNKDEIYAVMRDSTEPYFSNSNYSDAAKWFTNAVYIKLCGYYGVDYNGFENSSSVVDNIGDERDKYIDEEQSNLVQRIFVIIVLLIISAISATFVLKKLFFYSKLLEDADTRSRIVPTGDTRNDTTRNLQTINHMRVKNNCRINAEHFSGNLSSQRHASSPYHGLPPQDGHRYNTGGYNEIKKTSNGSADAGRRRGE